MSILGLDWVIFTGCGIAIAALSVAFVLLRKDSAKPGIGSNQVMRNEGKPFGE